MASQAFVLERLVALLRRSGCVVVAILLAPTAWGHGLDPAFLSLRDVDGGIYEITWRTAAERRAGADVQPLLPKRCVQVGDAKAELGSDHVTLRWRVNCGLAGLAGESIGIRDLDAAGINALLRIEESGRPLVQVVLNPRRMSKIVPAQPSTTGVLAEYGALGVEHILTGPDHLLFVFGLLLLVSSGSMLLKTITAFTVGHSVTLSAAALGVATPPARPIELLIALSVLALAVELTGDGRRTNLLRRSPWLMAGLFGLLHGFGFAGALAETGLPDGDVPLALLSFNLGIEAGQIAFVALVLVAGIGLRLLRTNTTHLRPIAVYTMGVLAAYWSLERAVEWLAG